MSFGSRGDDDVVVGAECHQRRGTEKIASDEQQLDKGGSRCSSFKKVSRIEIS